MTQHMNAQETEEGRGSSYVTRKLLEARTILVFEPISDAVARRLHTQLVILQKAEASAPVTVYINSPGGSADSGFAMFDALRFFDMPVTTVVNGLCASAAVMVQLAAPRQRRFAAPNARFLLHQPRTVARGQASDIEIEAGQMLRIREQYNAIVAQECGKTVAQVTKDSDRDFWLDAEQARAYGLVSKIAGKLSDLGV
ncbi:MAG TPA: ATP-dependent Clp protease proteolytic subunit [Planctomycetota bacterium]|nr:ATP-dependent Clp protease proteolytic subunit [Planctomycetota bacterium]